MDCAYIVKILKDKGVKFAEGLTHNEIDAIENLYDFRFPPDLKELLMYRLPNYGAFINWRDTSPRNIKHINERMNAPLGGIIFDIENNFFWLKDWGQKPESLNEAIKIATEEYYKAPKLIPIYAHRYIPATPFEYGNPIFSVHQTDIIFYGEDLTTYFLVEFGLMQQQKLNFENIKEIPFWSKIVYL